MQGYRVLEETLLYQAGKYRCELQMTRSTEPHKVYRLYDLEIVVDGANSFELYKQYVGELNGTFTIFALRHIIPATIEALDDWCRRNPYTFISFFDGLSSYSIFKIYQKLGFVCDGRADTFVAFVDERGDRTAFTGMLNLLAQDDLWMNDLWRVAKDTQYYVGNLETPLGLIQKVITQTGLNPDRPKPVVVAGDYRELVTAVHQRLAGQRKLLVNFEEPLGGSGQLRGYGSNERQRVWVIHQETRIAVVYPDRLEVMGFVVQEEDTAEYDLSPATVSAIASAIDKIDVSACE